MDYTQTIQPNLSIVGVEGLCLVYVREVFAIAAKYATALVAWDASSAFNHPGETPPSNISVPIFFTYNGSNDGHVCLWNEGTIHTTSAHGMQAFDSIQDLIDWMDEGFVYLGWSEELNGITIVETVAAPAQATAEIDQPDTPAETPAATTYTVVKNINGYITSNDAANHIGVIVPVEAKDYFIFNQHNGMINVTTKAGTPGSWINPNDNQVTDINPPAAPSEPEVPEVPAPTTLATATATTASDSDFDVTVPAPEAATSDSEETKVAVKVNKSPTAFETSYTSFLGPQKYLTKATTNVTDLSGVRPEKTLQKGDVKEIAGSFHKSGAQYLRTVESVRADAWYGIPSTAMTKMGKDMSDDDFDLMLEDLEDSALADLKAAKKGSWFGRLRKELKK